MDVQAVENGIMLQMGMAMTQKATEIPEKTVESLLEGLGKSQDTSSCQTGGSCPEGVGKNVNIVA